MIYFTWVSKMSIHPVDALLTYDIKATHLLRICIRRKWPFKRVPICFPGRSNKTQAYCYLDLGFCNAKAGLLPYFLPGSVLENTTSISMHNQIALQYWTPWISSLIWSGLYYMASRSNFFRHVHEASKAKKLTRKRQEICYAATCMKQGLTVFMNEFAKDVEGRGPTWIYMSSCLMC